jgi:antitoxin (DNA-binding transcriptional repressor) of toxin-antitoxin stability system
MPKMSAAETARSFTSVLERVQAGEEFEITCRGAVVAAIRPPSHRLLSSERFRECMRSAPPIDQTFARDLRDIRTSVNPDPA